FGADDRTAPVPLLRWTGGEDIRSIVPGRGRTERDRPLSRLLSRVRRPGSAGCLGPGFVRARVLPALAGAAGGAGARPHVAPASRPRRGAAVQGPSPGCWGRVRA